MTKIINNGREKTFRARCMDCVTDFSYTWEDVTEVETPYASLKWMQKQRYVTCPVCSAQVVVSMLTQEEWERNGPFAMGFHA